MGVKLGNGKWAIKEDKLLAYNDNSGRFFNKEFDFSRGSSATYVAKDGLIKTAGLQATNLVNNPSFSELGSELVTNGNFDTDSDWSKGAGATISNGRGNIIGDGSSFTNLSQSNVFTVGKLYKVTLDAVINSGLGLKVQDGSTNENFGVITTSGTYTFYGKANNSTLTIGRRTGGTAFNSYIDNVSVKQVDPNDYWTLGTGWGFGDGVATCDGNGNLDQIMDITNGNRYKVSFTILNSTQGTLGAYLSGGFGGNFGNGTHAIEITGGSASSYDLRFVPISSFNGSITNISVQEIQTDTPRIDFSDSVKGALLLEPSSTQLIQYSEDFSNSYFLKIRSTISNNQAISPDGTLTADKLIENNSLDTHLMWSQDISISVGDNITWSIFVKKGERNWIYLRDTAAGNFTSWFDLENGVVGTKTGTLQNKIEDYGNGWYRCSITYTSTSTTAKVRIYTAVADNQEPYQGDGTSGVYIWGAMVEQKSFSTSYIPNHGVSGGVTRLADVCNNSGSAQDFSQSGVLYADISALSDDQTNRRITISDGTNTNRVVMGYNTNSNQIFYFVVVGNSTVASGNYTSSDITQFSKVAIKFKANDFALWVDGIERHTDTSGIIFSENTLTSLQFEQGSGNSLFFYGKVREVQVFTEALTDEQLQKLTTI
jgi:hypothetical protein